MRWRAEPGSQLAAARMQVHRLLDCRVEFGGETMDEAYTHLAKRLGLPKAECHVGMFTLSECKRALAALENV